MSHYDNPAIQAAWDRAVQQAEEGVVVEPVGVFRKEAEMHVLAKQLGLDLNEAHEKLAECLRRNNVVWKDERYFPRNATLELIREAFAN